MFILAATLLLASPPDGPAPSVGDVPAEDTARYRAQVVAEGLEGPWDIAFLPGQSGSGDVLVTEKPGRLRVIRNGELMATAVAGVPQVHHASQAGLFEASPHPDFSDNAYLYLTYAKSVEGGNTLALGRGRYVPTAEGARLDRFEELFVADAVRESDAHYGGRIVWMDDGTMLLTSGEGYRYRFEAQELDSHFGKVLRLTDQGAAAPDNPFQGTPGVLPEIWSYGHRNPQGIAMANGTVFENEHGPRGGDEINVIEPGENYGWPIASYGIDYSGVQITPFATWEGTVQPVFHWTPSIAPSALAYYDGVLFPRWRGNLMTSALAGGPGQHVRIFDPAAPLDQTAVFGELEARIRDVAPAPDGSVWLALEKPGRIVRVTPVP